ncbi:TetR/AcrR family transcriptional regulator [Glycocaulis profundi]|nr:TetR/AcrR family transcriptional regulator [Glycocaulis profundi]
MSGPNVSHPAFPDHRSAFSRQQERELKRQAILSKASELFDEIGAANTRLEDISDQFGLSKNSVGYYFSGKDEIVLHAYRASHDTLREAIDRARASDGAPTAALMEAWAGIHEAILRRERPHVCLPREVRLLPGPSAAELQALFRQCLEDIEAIAAADFPRSGPVAAGLVVTALEWLSGRARAAAEGDLSAERAALARLFSSEPPGGAGMAPLTLTNPSSLPEIGMIFDRETRARIKREAFLRAGVRLLNARGYAGLSLAEVAESLGVTRGAFYYLFPDKEALLQGCLERSWSEIETVLKSWEAAGGAPETVIANAWKELIYRQLSGAVELVHPSLISALPDSSRAAHRARFNALQSRLAGPLADAQAPAPTERPALESLVFAMLFVKGHAFPTAAGLEKWPASVQPSSASVQWVEFVSRR